MEWNGAVCGLRDHDRKLTIRVTAHCGHAPFSATPRSTGWQQVTRIHCLRQPTTLRALPGAACTEAPYNKPRLVSLKGNWTLETLDSSD